MRLSKVRLRACGAQENVRGLLVLAQFVIRGAKVVQSFDVIRL